MANQVLLKKSSVAARVPTTSDLAYGEVALNYTDGKLYYKDSSNNIKYFLESAQTEATLDDVVTNGATTTTTAVIPFYYANQSDFPNATTYHGAIAHSHSDGAMYFAHGGSWNKLANDSQLASYQTISGLNAAIDSHLNQSNPTAGYVLSWNGTDYDWVDNAGYTDNDVDTHLNTSTASSSQVLYWNGTDYAWSSVGALGGGGIQYTDLSVTTAAAGTASLSYNNTNGVFTYTPPDLSSYLTSETTTSIALNGNSLDYTDELGNTTNISLAAYLDDTTNTVLSASLSGNTVTFTREDSTTFTLDVSNLYDDTNLVTSVNGQTGAVTGLLETSDIGSTVLAYDSNLQSFVTTFTLPTTDGTANQVLSTDGSGNLSFVDQSGGSGSSYAYGVTVTTDTFTGDNTTVDFTLTRGATDDGYAIVSLNGVVQDPVDYSLSENTLTFVTAPALNDNIDVRIISSGSATQVNVNYTRFLYSITSTQSSITGADDNGETLAYDPNSVEVYQNGIKLVAGDDFTATDGTTISFTDSLLNTDTVEVVSTGAQVPILTTNNIDENTATTTTTTANQVIDSWSATTYRTAKYILQAVNGSDVHSTEILLNHDETDVFITEYATIYSNASLFTVSAQLNGSTLELIATPANANTTFDLVRTLLVARTAPTSSGDLQSLSGSEDLGSGSGSEDLN